MGDEKFPRNSNPEEQKSLTTEALSIRSGPAATSLRYARHAPLKFELTPPPMTSSPRFHTAVFRER
jgi:hypothetical protein